MNNEHVYRVLAKSKYGEHGAFYTVRAVSAQAAREQVTRFKLRRGWAVKRVTQVIVPRID